MYYDGNMVVPSKVGSYVYDPNENGYAVRVRDEDVPYSCGIECCGIAEYAVVFVPNGDNALDQIRSLVHSLVEN